MKGSDVQEAREDPGRPDRKAYIQQKSVYRIQQKPRGRGARQRGPAGRLSRKGPNETMVEFRDVGTPACTRQTERLLCVDGHRAAAVQEKKEMGHRRSYREQQPRWWC